MKVVVYYLCQLQKNTHPVTLGQVDKMQLYTFIFFRLCYFWGLSWSLCIIISIVHTYIYLSKSNLRKFVRAWTEQFPQSRHRNSIRPIQPQSTYSSYNLNFSWWLLGRWCSFSFLLYKKGNLTENWMSGNRKLENIFSISVIGSEPLVLWLSIFITI